MIEHKAQPGVPAPRAGATGDSSDRGSAWLTAFALARDGEVPSVRLHFAYEPMIY